MFIQYTANLLASQTDGKDRRMQAFKHWTKGEEREGRRRWKVNWGEGKADQASGAFEGV